MTPCTALPGSTSESVAAAAGRTSSPGHTPLRHGGARPHLLQPTVRVPLVPHPPQTLGVIRFLNVCQSDRYERETHVFDLPFL